MFVKDNIFAELKLGAYRGRERAMKKTYEMADGASSEFKRVRFPGWSNFTVLDCT